MKIRKLIYLALIMLVFTGFGIKASDWVDGPVGVEFSDFDDGLNFLVCNHTDRKITNISFSLVNSSDVYDVWTTRKIKREGCYQKNIPLENIKDNDYKVIMKYKDKSKVERSEVVYHMPAGVKKHLVVIEMNQVKPDGVLQGTSGVGPGTQNTIAFGE